PPSEGGELNRMKVLIAAGGTGGHIYPGIAVAKEIMRRDAASDVRFVGTTRGLETRIVPENGFQLSLINSAGLKNVGIVGKLKGLALLPKSFLEARTLLKEFKPDVVVGAGGYVSGPVLMTASLMSIPTLVMDSNALPGFTNRRLAMFVDKAALTFEEAMPFFGKKGIVTGNPVRREFFEIDDPESTDKVRLLIFGGSQGARAINKAIVDALPLLDKDRIEVTHQTGDVEFEKVREGYERAGVKADIRQYISEMVSEFAKTDLIICRAGATTCAELAAAGKASIMIPLPTAADDHQRKNAEAMQRAGASRMILQKDLNGETLAKEIKKLTASPEAIAQMESSAKKLARRDAAEATVDLIKSLVRKK
ncbi:MAG TPA: undecaprenyldiphospho-muramoylpentapeptide beta-N-acetylglucosaminyltransferase, partial [Pyrinomonadaceae bacterium]|nr:undecaprenyldiphospho-muramoylpentapeptide beta-N-acetylglucosaminyltransferase [Pyrinomonadaceae bacterium]